MDTSGKDFNNDLSSKGQAFADKIGRQGAERDPHRAAGERIRQPPRRRTRLNHCAARRARRSMAASDTAQSIFRQAIDAVSDATRKAQDLASDTQDSIVTYTRQKPVKALLIAAAAGAVLVTLVRAISPSSRD